MVPLKRRVIRGGSGERLRIWVPAEDPLAKGGAPGVGSGDRRHLAGLVGILWCTGVAQVGADAGLAQKWPRQSDAGSTESQVGKPGR